MALILALDDHDLFLSALRDVLTCEGHLVVATPDTFEGWALLHALPFDLVTQDSERPDVGGGDFYDRLRADPLLPPVPVIMMADGAARRWASRVGIAAYVAKGFDPLELLDSIEMVLSEYGYQSRKKLSTAAKIEAVFAMTHPDQLIPALGDPLPEVRFLAAWVVGQHRLTRAIPSLLAALDDVVDHVRGAAALALGRMQAHVAFGPLVTALGDPSPLARMLASRALLHLGDDRAVDPLLACVKDDDFWVRVSAARAAGRLKENDPMLFREAWDF